MQISNSSSFVIDNLLAFSQRKALFSLEQGTLKDRLVNDLLSEGYGLKFEVAQLAIKIIQSSDSSPIRDKFLVLLLNEITDSKESLKKVISFIKGGYFQEFLHTIDSKTKKFHDYQKLREKILFFDQTESQNRLNSDLTQHQIPLPSFRSTVYDEIQACPYFYKLSKLAEKYARAIISHRLSFQDHEGKLHFLFQQLDGLYENKFENYEKTALIKIIFRIVHTYNIDEIGETTFYTEEDLDEFLSFAYTLKKETGEEILNYFFISVKQQPAIVSLHEMIRALQLLNAASQDEKFHSLIEDWRKTSFNWDQLFEILESYLTKSDVDEPLFQEDISLTLQRFANDPTVTRPLPEQDLILIGNQLETVNSFCRDYQKYFFHQLMNLADQLRTKARKEPLSEEERLRLIAIGRLAIRLHFGINLYTTQILALLGTLIRGESRQAQIKTGEGKSFIVTLWAFVMAMECRGVDIITSTRYLAARDQEKFVFFLKDALFPLHIFVTIKKSLIISALKYFMLLHLILNLLGWVIDYGGQTCSKRG